MFSLAYPFDILTLILVTISRFEFILGILDLPISNMRPKDATMHILFYIWRVYFSINLIFNLYVLYKRKFSADCFTRSFHSCPLHIVHYSCPLHTCSSITVPPTLHLPLPILSKPAHGITAPSNSVPNPFSPYLTATYLPISYLHLSYLFDP